MTHPTHGSALSPPSYPQSYGAYSSFRPAAPAQPYRLPPSPAQPSTLPYGQQVVQPSPQGDSMVVRRISAPVRRSHVQAWIIGVLGALLVATGIGVVLVLQDDSLGVTDPPSQGAPGNPGNAGSESAPAPREVPSPPTDCLVECTEPDDPDGSQAPDGAGGNYTGSDDAAWEFVQAIANGDSVSAHSALCGSGKTMFPTPEDLVSDFYATLGFSTITGARLTDVYAADSTLDAVVFDLETDAGDVLVEVYVVEEVSSLTVCGYGV